MFANVHKSRIYLVHDDYIDHFPCAVTTIDETPLIAGKYLNQKYDGDRDDEENSCDGDSWRWKDNFVFCPS